MKNQFENSCTLMILHFAFFTLHFERPRSSVS